MPWITLDLKGSDKVVRRVPAPPLREAALR